MCCGMWMRTIFLFCDVCGLFDLKVFFMYFCQLLNPHPHLEFAFIQCTIMHICIKSIFFVLFCLCMFSLLKIKPMMFSIYLFIYLSVYCNVLRELFMLKICFKLVFDSLMLVLVNCTESVWPPPQRLDPDFKHNTK